MSHKIIESNYKNLIGNISKIYEKTQQILVEANWEIGRQIIENEQLNSDRAEYGAEVIARLSEDLSNKYGPGFSIRNLRNMRTFYSQNRIRQSIAELAWTKYVALLSIKDNEVRKEIVERAIDENLSVADVKKIVLQVNAELKQKSTNKTSPQKKIPKLKFTRGVLNQYKLLPSSDIKTNTVDCGFNTYREIPIRSSNNPTKKPSHTYLASVNRVVDGDTLLVTIDLGFKTKTRQRLRLKGIDAPPLKTKEGEKSRRFVQKILRECEFVVIRTYQIDMYARYIADIFYLPGETNAKRIASEGSLLNQEILDSRLAKVFVKP